MDTKDIINEISKALYQLESVDFMAKGKAIQNSNAKKVHKAYDILYNLKNKL